jgi:hypothetical protein
VFTLKSAVPDIVFTRSIGVPGERTAFYQQVKSGRYTCIFRGCFVRADEWLALDAREQHCLRAIAVSEYVRSDVIFSHWTAAALWQLPILTHWPTRVHAIAQPFSGLRSGAALSVHKDGGQRPVSTLDKCQVTGLASTVADMSAIVEFRHGVAIADAALHGATDHSRGMLRPTVSQSDLLVEASKIAWSHGARRALDVAEFADGLAESPGESISRVAMRQARIPIPQLQARLKGTSGRTWTADFWWPQFNVIGEFDGQWKYTEPLFLNGRTPRQVLIHEKDREDDLRAAGFAFARWDWATALSPVRLSQRLGTAGVR